MNERQQNLLELIVTQYIKTALPVGSQKITQSGDFALSSATIRNEMAKLETDGYIFQPHTSAGRAPTQKGYQFHVDNFLDDSDLSRKNQDFLARAIKPFDKYNSAIVKELAKGLVELADNTVFVGFSNNDFYYTGLSNLFSQPEFTQRQFICNVSRVIDHLDSVIKDIFNSLDHKVQILVGNKNPFGSGCSSVITKYKTKSKRGVIGILGPTRMDYQNNLNLIKHAQKLINNF